MNLNIQQLVGPVCMTSEDGEKLYAAYRPAFEKGETVELDFAGTRIFVSQFFNASVGQLLKDYDISEVQQRLKILNLPAAAIPLLKGSVENAQRYYRDPKFRESLDRVLSDQAVEA
jgi:hypothetical protein